MIHPYQYQHEETEELPPSHGLEGVWFGLLFMLTGLVLFVVATLFLKTFLFGSEGIL